MSPELNEYPEFMTMTSSLHNGDMYSVHLFTEETVLV